MFKTIRSILRAARLTDRQMQISAARYWFTRKLVDARFGRQKPRGVLATPGGIVSSQSHERGIVLNAEQGAFRLTVIAPDCIQVRYQPTGKFPVPFSYAVAKVTWPDVPFSVNETDEAITLTAPEIVCRVNRQDSRLTFLDAQGQVIGQDAEPLAWREGEFKITRSLPADEGCHGLAAQPVGFDLRGKRYLLWNTDPGGTARNKIPSYYTIPFYLGVHPDFVSGLFLDNSSRGWVDVGAEHRERLTFCASLGEVRYYQFAGATLNAVLQRYTELTGRMPMPPLWALGFHISRWSYTPADRVREIARELRKRKIPCDAIYLDIDYMDGYRCFTWNPTTFPAPAVLIGDLADQGFKTVTILDPGIKVDPEYAVYKSGLSTDVFLKYPNGRRFVGPCWPGDAVYPDFSSAQARSWWAAQFDTLFRPGVAGIWNDMNEPVIFSPGKQNNMPDSVRHDLDGQGGNHVEGRNIYGMLMARATREALVKAHPNKRPFNIVRAAHAGAQRYASTWTGDSHSDWDHLCLSVSMVLNSGLSGLAFNGPDVGGFGGNAEPELFTRWVQLGAFMPFFRVHTALNTAPQEPWAFGQPYEDIARQYITLRYQLLPYVYAAFAQSAQYGWPIVRPLFSLDPTDEKLRGIEDAYMFGDSLLVAPIFKRGQVEREVYLPHGAWFDYHTGQRYEGGKTIVAPAPLDTLPLFARAGHVIPLWPAQQYVGQAPVAELRLKIYYGDGEIALYEDAGEGMDYLSGVYRWLYFTCKQLPDDSLEVSWRQAGNYQPPYGHVRCEVYGITFEPAEVRVNDSAAPLWYFEKGVVEFTAGQSFENVTIVAPDRSSIRDTLLRSPFKD